MTDMATEKTGGVQAVSRALGLLKRLGAATEGQRVSDLAAQAGLAVSTTHRLLTTLEHSGFAHFEPTTSKWHVGHEAFAVGASYVQKRSYVAPALTYLRRLRDETRETANLGHLDDGHLVTLSQVESREIMRAISPPGGRVPATCSAMGKALLATWPDAQIAEFCDRHGFPTMTPRSVDDLPALMDQIKHIRAQGYAVDNEEHARGLRCLAAPVWGPDGDAVCAISVSAMMMRLTGELTKVVARRVVTAASELTEKIGGKRAKWPLPPET
ncbi:transcriptional regulator, IclR family [Celeribacter baekdonensis]|uniref:Transcriptional regulator, IclR family n=2 Tax=Celeribacter baekdonensis TaxID=875171 RepID=A0A1G7RBE6_9RHOB|nr:transcriptional regulator, IclR family [Celeribacter baekdonensis]